MSAALPAVIIAAALGTVAVLVARDIRKDRQHRDAMGNARWYQYPDGTEEITVRIPVAAPARPRPAPKPREPVPPMDPCGPLMPRLGSSSKKGAGR